MDPNSYSCQTQLFFFGLFHDRGDVTSCYLPVVIMESIVSNPADRYDKSSISRDGADPVPHFRDVRRHFLNNCVIIDWATDVDHILARESSDAASSQSVRPISWSFSNVHCSAASDRSVTNYIVFTITPVPHDATPVAESGSLFKEKPYQHDS
jgi:hypothetical protein